MAGSPPPKGLVLDEKNASQLAEWLKEIEEYVRKARQLIQGSVENY